jgi:hypothetical protein
VAASRWRCAPSSRRSSICCTSAASGKRCPRSALAARAPSTSAFWNGNAPASSLPCGAPNRLSTTRWKASPDAGRAWTGPCRKRRWLRKPLGQPDGSGEKRQQANAPGRRLWRPAVDCRDRR